MSDPNSNAEAKIAELSARLDSLMLGYRIAGMAILFLFSCFNIGGSYAIEYFRQIFSDNLPGRNLPLLSKFFIEHQGLLITLAFVWLILGFGALGALRKASSTLSAMACLLVLTLLQIALTWVALFTPLISLTSNLSN